MFTSKAWTDDSKLLQESNLTESQHQATTGEELAQGPYTAARVEFESATLRMQGTELTTEPPLHKLCHNIMPEQVVCQASLHLALALHLHSQSYLSPSPLYNANHNILLWHRPYSFSHRRIVVTLTWCAGIQSWCSAFVGVRCSWQPLAENACLDPTAASTTSL